MDDQSAEDGAGAVGQDAQHEAAKERGDAFTQRLAEMDRAIEGGHGQNGLRTGDPDQPDDQESAEEQFDTEEVQPVGELVS
jgi:hypothetical protein